MDKSLPKTVRLADLLRPIQYHWRLSLMAFIGVLLTVAIVTISSNRMYEATATLSIREIGDLQSRVLEVPGVFFQKYLLKNQVAILESRTLATKVIQKLGVSPQKDSLSILGNMPESAASPLRKWLLSRILPDPPPKSAPSMQQMVKKFRSNSRVVYGQDTDIVELYAMAPTPWEAAELVNEWVTTYQDYTKSDSRGEVSQTKVFLEEQLEEVQKNLSLSEERLTRFQKENQVVSLTDETEELVRQLASFESLYNQTITESQGIKDQLTYLKNQLNDSKQNLVEDMVKTSNPVLQQLQETMANLVARKATLEAQLVGAGVQTENNVEIAELENRILVIKDNIITETKKLISRDFASINPLEHSEKLINQILDLETTSKSLNAKAIVQSTIIEEYTRQLKTLPDKSQELARLQRDVRVNNNLYVMLHERHAETKIREAGQVGNVRVIDMAFTPISSVRPRFALNITLGFFFGILLGIALAFGKEFFEDTVRTEEDMEECGIDIMGRIPLIKPHRHLKNHGRNQREWNIFRAKQIYPYLLIHNNGSSLLAESYRTVRTSISVSSRTKSNRTILLTSPDAAEGKSTTAANLSIIMARKGMKTLIVDSDLRRPVLDILFMGSHRRVGLTNVLGREIPWREAVRETTIDGLHLMPAGTSVKNAPEILSSRTMISFIKETRNEYGAVIFDSPPLLPVTDAAILGSVVDGVILVVRSGRATKESIRRSVDLLYKVDAHILGAVLTGLQDVHSIGYKNYYLSYIENDTV